MLLCGVLGGISTPCALTFGKQDKEAVAKMAAGRPESRAPVPSRDPTDNITLSRSPHLLACFLTIRGWLSASPVQLGRTNPTFLLVCYEPHLITQLTVSGAIKSNTFM